MSLRRPGSSPASIDISSAIEWPSLVVLLLLFPLSIRSISPGRLLQSASTLCPVHCHSCILVAKNMGIPADIVVCSEIARIRYYLSQAFNLSTARQVISNLLYLPTSAWPQHYTDCLLITGLFAYHLSVCILFRLLCLHSRRIMPPQQQQPRLRGRGQVNRAGGSDSVTRQEMEWRWTAVAMKEGWNAKWNTFTV